jgi:hypothetical protein
MVGEIVQTPSGKYVKYSTGSGLIAEEQDLLDLLAYCSEAKTDRILLHEKHLHPNFFDLKTGLAGTLFLKLSTYRVKTAIVANWEGRGERFQELVYECNQGNQINFFRDRSKAEMWLTTG